MIKLAKKYGEISKWIYYVAGAISIIIGFFSWGFSQKNKDAKMNEQPKQAEYNKQINNVNIAGDGNKVIKGSNNIMNVSN
jgi:hypothetical protein